MSDSDYVACIGLEVHVQLKTQTKMFCGCPVGFGNDPNTQTCPTCLGLPGALPVLNKEAIRRTVLTGQMLGCSTPDIVKWDRKNYFYPDMPKNYQISQFDLPLCEGGGVPLYELAYPKDHQKEIVNPDKTVGLTRIHLEEDVAKSTHHDKGGYTTIDFNRAGTPLMEIVSEPEIDSAEEAVAYLNSLRQILVYSGVSDADMDKGQMRCDVNISVRKKSDKELGTKIELKNLNSVSVVRKAIHFEIDRQIEKVKKDKNAIRQATWRWDDEIGQTTLMRLKENADDYRYFPDPDLLPVKTEDFVAAVQTELPELPHEKVQRFEDDYKITHYDASVLAGEVELAEYFEQAVENSKAPKKVANWVINNLLGELKENDLGISECPIEPGKMGQLVELIEAGTISNTQAKEVFAELFTNPKKSPEKIAKDKGFEPADNSDLDAWIDQVIEENPGPAAEVTEGNDKAVNRLTGQVMKLSKGKANPKLVTEALLSKLKG